jgi:ankyrin repeat protein
MAGVVESLLARDDLDANIVDECGGVHASVFIDRHEIDPNAVSAGIVIALSHATALMYACADGDMDAVRLLLDQEP